MYLNRERSQVSIPQISLSVISTSPLQIFKALNDLKQYTETSEPENFESGLRINRLHVDIMDGHFVPRLGLYPEFVKELKTESGLLIDIHLMTSNPFSHLEIFAQSGADRVIPHIESTAHPHRIITEIKNLGMRAGIALNPGTPIGHVENLIDEVDNVIIMGINPGIVGHRLIPATIKKVEQARLLLSKHKFDGVLEVDGGVTLMNAKQIIEAGASSLVCGSGTILNSANSSQENFLSLSRLLTV
jgi:ribulose-phosphate 3-epimerase